MRFQWTAAGLLALALPGWGCSTGSATPPLETGSSESSLVSRRGVFQARMLLTGELEAVRAQRILVPRTPVWELPIRWLEIDGALVVEGQRVLELDNSQFTGDIEQKRLAESGAYNDLQRKRADVEVATAEKEFALEQRRIELAKARIEAEVPEHLRSRRDYQEDQLDLVRAESAHQKAQRDLDTTRRASAAEMEELKIALDRTADEIARAEAAIQALVLAAPRDGILVVAENRNEGRKFQVGDNVWVGLEVMRIPDLSAMTVVARLSDVDDGTVAPGMRARCTLDIYPDRSFEGSIVEIAPIAQEEDEQSLRRAFRVEIALDESDAERMRPGMSVRAEVLAEAREGAVLVPRIALDLVTDPPRALLRDGSSVEVRLGPCDARECVVEEGIGEGIKLRAHA